MILLPTTGSMLSERRVLIQLSLGQEQPPVSAKEEHRENFGWAATPFVSEVK